MGHAAVTTSLLPAVLRSRGMATGQTAGQLGDEESLPLTIDVDEMKGSARVRLGKRSEAEAAAPRHLHRCCMLLTGGELPRLIGPPCMSLLVDRGSCGKQVCSSGTGCATLQACNLVNISTQLRLSHSVACCRPAVAAVAMLLWVASSGRGTGVWRRAQQAASGRAQQPPAVCPLPYQRMSFEQVRGGERPYLFGAQPANCTSCRRGFNATSLVADDHDYCEFWSQVRRDPLLQHLLSVDGHSLSDLFRPCSLANAERVHSVQLPDSLALVEIVQLLSLQLVSPC
jgi:hypothetical protein